MKSIKKIFKAIRAFRWGNRYCLNMENALDTLQCFIILTMMK